mmetsp:Transcript_41693/g.124667  ORF Transcript_41693/g.124667 Transcript_41693/m.124667 type:complete len:223 (-) Transcript_41693:1076-1744(-)
MLQPPPSLLRPRPPPPRPRPKEAAGRSRRVVTVTTSPSPAAAAKGTVASLSSPSERTTPPLLPLPPPLLPPLLSAPPRPPLELTMALVVHAMPRRRWPVVSGGSASGPTAAAPLPFGLPGRLKACVVEPSSRPSRPTAEAPLPFGLPGRLKACVVELSSGPTANEMAFGFRGRLEDFVVGSALGVPLLGCCARIDWLHIIACSKSGVEACLAVLIAKAAVGK